MILTFLHIIPSLFSAPDDLSVSDDMEKGVINSIKIEGVKGEGDYNYDLSDNKWDLSKSTAAGSYTVSFDGEDGKVEGKRALTGGVNDKKVLMMIPQELGGGAKVTINFTPTGKSATEASFSLGGTTWVAGNHVTYLLSTTKIIKLNMGSVTYPQWQTAEGSPFTSEKLKSSYVSGDTIGMYVVDKYNKVIEENLKFTYNGSKWTVEPGKKFKGFPQYNYFVYYPYQSRGLPGAPAKGTEATEENVASADNFFANAIDTWKSSKITADQSTLDMMNACDLQIDKASSLDEAGLNISFAMKHTMGLAEITLGAKPVDTNYYLSNYPEYTWKNTTTFHAYAGISGYSLYKVADYRYVALVKPDITTVFSCDSSTDPDSWTENVSVKPAANCVASVTATSKRRTSLPAIPYTMEVGDIYYSDGGMTHQSEALASGKTPIGIVGYLGSDFWTEKDTKGKGIGGHALVMCLKTIGSIGSTVDAQEDYKKYRNDGPKVKAYIGTKYAWYSSNIDAGRTKVNSKSLLVNSYNQTYGSGYTETDALIQKWGKNAPAGAAYQAKKYNTLPATSSKCTGWFLPTAGQYYAVMKTLGAPFSDDWTGIWDGTSTHPKLGFFDNMATVTTNINNKLMKVGDTKYTEFFGDINTWAWTSSEFSSTAAVIIDSGVNNSKGSGSVRFNANLNKTDQNPVRPFLAF